MTTSPASLHTVNYDGQELRFKCAGGPDAACHTYPDCDCEVWEPGHRHPSVAHEDCWLQAWFDSAALTYAGADAVSSSRYITVPAKPASGPVTVTQVADDHLAWRWAGDPAPQGVAPVTYLHLTRPETRERIDDPVNLSSHLPIDPPRSVHHDQPSCEEGGDH